jgi:hypothetical protein
VIFSSFDPSSWGSTDPRGELLKEEKRKMEDYGLYLTVYSQVISGNPIAGEHIQGLLRSIQSEEEGIHQLQIVASAAYHAKTVIPFLTQSGFEELLKEPKEEEE